MLLRKEFNAWDLTGVVYDFQKAGDVLEKHSHSSDTVHITIVAKGKVKAYSHDWEKIADAGAILDFRPNEPHEFMALEDDTRIVNIVKKYGGHNNDYGDQTTDVAASQGIKAVKV
jgi:quercetin dioxygenase-like cupin family protein